MPQIDNIKDKLVAGKVNSSNWWTQTDAAAAQAIDAIVSVLRSYRTTRFSRYRSNVALYGQYSLFGSLMGSDLALQRPNRLSQNVVQSNIDTLVSKLSKNQPRAKYQTNLAPLEDQDIAKKLTYLTDGIYAENNAYDLGRMALRDALVFGDGFIHAYNDEGRVRFERVLPFEILVDDNEAAYGSPRSLYRTKVMDRNTLKQLFPDRIQAIESAMPAQFGPYSLTASKGISDMVEVVEAWHLPSSKKAKDGKHIICVGSAPLTKMEDWDCDYFPFAHIQWTSGILGFWGQSLAEQLKSIQLELNELLAAIQTTYRLVGTTKVLLPMGSSLPPEHINNNFGSILQYSGNTPPQYLVPPMIAPEMYRQVETLIQRSFQQSGVSSLSASSMKPAGLNSGKALMEYNDIETERFRAIAKDFERFYMDLAKISVSMARMISASTKGSYPVYSPDKKGLSKVDWKEIDLKEEDYTISCFPASSLPTEPAGRIAIVDDLIARGLIDKDDQWSLLEFPDVEAAAQLNNAPLEYLKKIFTAMLKDGEYTSPEKYDNLPLARRQALLHYAKGKELAVKEENLELIRTFLAELDEIESSLATPPEAQPPLPPEAIMPPNTPVI